MQVDDATDIIEGGQLITYVKYVVKTDVRKDLLFTKCIEGNSI